VIRIPNNHLIVRAFTGFVLAAAITEPSLAQDQSQLLQQLQQAQVQSQPQMPPSSASSISAAGATPPGYNPTTPEPWPRSGWISSAGMRPLAPGYVPNENGEIVFNAQIFPYRRQDCWSPGWLFRKIGECHQEKTSFQMYIRGYGPAIHTRPASIWW
jgi:hypothetical protein